MRLHADHVSCQKYGPCVAAIIARAAFAFDRDLTQHAIGARPSLKQRAQLLKLGSEFLLLFLDPLRIRNQALNLRRRLIDRIRHACQIGFVLKKRTVR